MTTDRMNPAAGCTTNGARIAQLGGSQSDNTTQAAIGKPTLVVRTAPDTEPVALIGRVAQTLALLMRKGAAGVTSGEASPLGWARRTSQYVFRLRGYGFEIETHREKAFDGVVIARYVLTSPVEVLQEWGLS